MRIDPRIAALGAHLTDWRRDLHSHPELAFAEQRTAGLIAERLQSFGLQPQTGIGGTGIVAVIDSNSNGLSLGLRADMDALPMDDQSGVPYRSNVAGCAHTCGHDGHTTSLLGVAEHLAKHPPTRGRVVLIFQPAEEVGLGAPRMLEDGLFRRFPCDEIYAFHNMPLLGKGIAAVRSGPTLAASADYEIDIRGVGGHSAAPHTVVDPIQAGARLVAELSAIVGRYVDPAETATVAVGRFNAGTTLNIIPDSASLAGTIRTYSKDSQHLIIERIRKLCVGLASAYDCRIDFRIPALCPPCVNSEEQAKLAAGACADVLGLENVRTNVAPYPFTDDFAFFLEQCPGAYLFLGQDGAMCHHASYDFDDGLLTVAASVFARIVERRLGDAD